MIRLTLHFVALLLLALALPAHAESTLRIGNGSEPETLDPQRASTVSSANILRDVYEGLTEIDPDGEIRPAAASHWTMSSDGLRYEFELRADARWSDGTELRAEHFVTGFRRALDPRTGSPSAQLLLPIANASAVLEGQAPPETLGVKALSPRRLQITLARPTAYFLGVLTHPISFPTPPDASIAQRREARVGNGAYRLDRWTPNASLELVRNPFYWNRAAVQIDRVVYLPTEDGDAELKRYRAGEIDVTGSIPLVQAPKIRARFGSELRIAPYLGSYYYAINVTRPPFAGNRKLRQALALAIDREVIVERVMNGLAIPAYGWVPPGIANYIPQHVVWAEWPRERRLAEAKRLYAEAGYSAAHPLSIELLYNTSDDHKRIATVIAAMWKQNLGVRTEMVNQEFKVYLSTRRARRVTQIFRAGWIADYDDASSFLDLISSYSADNDTGWSHPRYDALLREASITIDPVKRAGLLASAESLMLDDMPVIPIYHYVSKHLVKPYVRGWTDNAQDVQYSKNLRVERP